MAKVQDVADYFISLSQEGTPKAVTPLKLQKLVYYAQGFYLQDNHNPLFEDEILAWEHGTVNRFLFNKYSHLKYRTIPKEDFVFNNEHGEPRLEENERRIIDLVWDRYGHLNGKFLEELNHQERPWLETNRNEVIKLGLIEDYFKD